MVKKSVKKSKEELDRIRKEKHKTKRIEKAMAHFALTFFALIVAFGLAAFLPWVGFKVILVLATLWASFSSDNLDQNDRDEVTLGVGAFVVRTLLLAGGSLSIATISVGGMDFFAYFGAVLVILMVLGFCGHLLQQNEKYKKNLAAAYINAQNALSKNPNNPELRQAALQAGREYYAACRGDGTITIYDEAAINNDIQACLGSDRSNK